MDKGGNVKTLPLFVDINDRAPKYTFSHPTGLLFATPFAQIALVVTEKVACDDLASSNPVVRSLVTRWESTLLFPPSPSPPILSLFDVVFYHGITMQRAVERDAHNCFNYVMCAVPQPYL
jgi:fatty acid synthase subunit alpha, fungi type